MERDQINRAFEGVQHLRGPIDTRVINRYSFVMFFLKYITDHWKEANYKYKLLYGDDQELIERKMSRERFVLSEKASFDRIVAEKYNPNVGYIVNQVLNNIESMNRETLSGIFGHVDFNSEYELGDIRSRNLFLQGLISLCESLNFSPSVSDQKDLINTPVESVAGVAEIAKNIKKGEFFTPSDISTLVVKLMKPEVGEQIYDPVCGSGGLLIAAAKELEENHGANMRNYELYGQEINKETCSLARMNIYLAGLDNAQIAEGNVLIEPAWTKDNTLTKFDVVVSHIPFSSYWEEQLAYTDPYHRFIRGIPPQSKGDYAFIQHIIASSKNGNGRMGIIVSLGALFRGGREASIREKIISDNLLDAVIALPHNLLPTTTIPCAVLVLSKTRKQNENVLFIDATKHFEQGKYQNKLRTETIDQIVFTFRQFKEDSSVNQGAAKEGFSRVVTRRDIATLEYNLNVSGYVHANQEEDKKVDVPLLQKKIASLEEEIVSLQSIIQKSLKELGL
jgi:type I restriction enzyme M protein